MSIDIEGGYPNPEETTYKHLDGITCIGISTNPMAAWTINLQDFDDPTKGIVMKALNKVRGQDVNPVQILISALSGATLIIVGIVAYFMKDTNEQTREMMRHLERVSSQVETASKDNDRLRADVEDIRNVLYNHITMTKN